MEQMYNYRDFPEFKGYWCSIASIIKQFIGHLLEPVCGPFEAMRSPKMAEDIILHELERFAITATVMANIVTKVTHRTVNYDHRRVVFEYLFKVPDMTKKEIENCLGYAQTEYKKKYWERNLRERISLDEFLVEDCTFKPKRI